MNDQHAHQTDSVGIIILPSGQAIRVIRHGAPEPCERDLCDCRACGSDLVEPTEWAPVPGGQWLLALRCPNCGRCESGTFSAAQVERLEDHLDNGLGEMITDLQQLARANMAADVDRFLGALEAGYILPEDF